MLYIWTAFDKTGKTKPLMSAVFDSEANKVEFYPLYGYGGKGTEVIKRLEYLASLFDYPVVTNDFKGHIEGFNYLRDGLPPLLATDKDYSVYVVPHEEDYNFPREPKELIRYLAGKISYAKKMGPPAQWQLLLGDASLVYLDLQKRGVLRGGLPEYPRYEFITTGRVSASGFNTQGQNEDTELAHVDEDKNIFIHADWIAADIRGAAILSGDEKMLQSFEKSDPYTDMANAAGKSRSEFKNKVVLPGFYSLNLESEIYKYYPKFKDWGSNAIEMMDSQGFATSILGRRFYVKTSGTDEEMLKSRRQVFNAQIQGTTAHAMQNAIVQIHKRLPRNLLVELHDSVVVCCSQNDVKTVMGVVTDIMLHPFRNILSSDPTYPLKVSIGSKWYQWKQLREIR